MTRVNRYRTDLRRAVVGGIALTTALAAVVLSVPAQASVPPPATFHWTGADAVATGNHNWSDAANWAEGQAPQPRQTVSLVFPALACVADGVCGTSTNDVSGLTASSISITSRGGTVFEGGGEYFITGLPMRLTGPLSATGDTSTGTYISPVHFGIPLQLLSGHNKLPGAGQWSISGVFTYLDSDVSGARLTITENNTGEVRVGGNIEVAKFVVLGNSAGYIYVDGTVGGKINYDNGHQVKVKYTDLYMLGSFGDLVTKHSNITLADPDGFAAPLLDQVNGDATFDPDSKLTADRFGQFAGAPHEPIPGEDYPVLQATGTVSLANMRFVPLVRCTTEPGTQFPFIQASLVTGLLDDASGNPIPDGGTITAEPGGQCDAGGPVVRINYVHEPGSDSVVLTFVG